MCKVRLCVTKLPREDSFNLFGKIRSFHKLLLVCPDDLSKFFIFSSKSLLVVFHAFLKEYINLQEYIQIPLLSTK